MAEPKNRPITVNSAKSDKVNNKPWGIIIAIAAAAIVVVAAICAILFFANKSNNSGNSSDTSIENAEYTLTNGKGEKIPAKYASMKNAKYQVLVPANFDLYDSAKLEAEFNNSDSTEMAYTNSGNSVNILFSKLDSEAEMSNDDVDSYLEILKNSYSQLDKNIKTKSRTVGDHNIGELEFTTEGVYNHIVFFSYENKLALILFNCEDNLTDEWKQIGNEIINSLKFE